MYASYSKLTIGLGKAAKISSVLKDLDARYGAAAVPGVVEGAAKNSFYTPEPSDIDFDKPSIEMQVLEGVLKTKELLAAGYNKDELAAEIQPLIVGIRHEIGTTEHGVYAKQRNAAVRKFKATAKRAQAYDK